ncbi:MAG: CHAT domain-containing protein, partial [Cyanobacteria bacterium J007]
EPIENLRIAINCYFEAQKLLTENTLSWAILQNNLGGAYSSKLIFSRENLEKSIQYLNKALSFYKQETYPKEWADVKSNLGLVYRGLSTFSNGAENLEKAHQAYKDALQVRKPDYLPEKYAKTQCNLGVLYSVQNSLENAEAAYKAGLKIYKLDMFPEDWAMIQENLAYVYLPLSKTDSFAFQKIVQYLCNSLEVLKPSEFPLKCMKAASVLGSVAYDRQDWNNTIYGYERVIQSVEQSRNWAISPQTKRNVLENALFVYDRMIEACLQLNRPDQALLTVERSKARILIELLSSANLVPQNATPEQQEHYRKLNQEIASLQFPVNDTSNLLTLDPSATGRSFSEIESPTSPQVRYLKTLLQQRETLLEEIDDPDFKALIEVVPELPDFSQFLSPTTALIEWYLPLEPALGVYLFLVTRQPDQQIQITPHHFSATDRQQLDAAIEDYRSDYGQPTWNDRLPQRLETLSAALQLPRILAKLSQIQHLILIPHRELHLIPLHALPVSLPSPSGRGARGEGQPLQDWFPVQYAPSCQILNNLQQRPSLNRETVPFFAIQNPTEDLDYAELGVELLLRQFSPHQVLPRDQATLDNLTQPHIQTFLEQSHAVLFGCHGEFDDDNPLNAYLRLANGDKLTFLDIFNGLNIPLCRLLVLSACKTGLVETSSTDDYVGLSSAFFYAGARTVVASLWNVDELAATLVILRLYQILPDYPSVAVALQAAQTWLRGVSCDDVLHWLQHDLKATEEEVEAVEDRLDLFEDDPPFAKAYYWSAFTAIGL